MCAILARRQGTKTQDEVRRISSVEKIRKCLRSVHDASTSAATYSFSERANHIPHTVHRLAGSWVSRGYLWILGYDALFFVNADKRY